MQLFVVSAANDVVSFKHDTHKKEFGCVIVLILCCNVAADDADDTDAEDVVDFDSVVCNTVLDNIVLN